MPADNTPLLPSPEDLISMDSISKGQQQGKAKTEPKKAKPSHDPAKPLPDKRAEQMIQLVVQGSMLHEAYTATSTKDISRSAAYTGATKLRKDRSFMARLDFMKGQKVTEQVIDVTSRDGRVSAFVKLWEAYTNGELRAMEAIHALKELASLYGDKEAMENERKRLDPSEVCAWLVRCELEGQSPARVIMQGDGLEKCARAAREAMDADEVTVRDHGRTFSARRPRKAAQDEDE